MQVALRNTRYSVAQKENVKIWGLCIFGVSPLN